MYRFVSQSEGFLVLCCGLRPIYSRGRRAAATTFNLDTDSDGFGILELRWLFAPRLAHTRLDE